MRISKKTEYALRALTYAANHPQGTTFPIKELAARNGIPKKFLELILLDLKNAGLVSSRRGVGGGYLLARPPEAIRSTEIIRAIEGPLSPLAAQKETGRRPPGEEPSAAVSRLVREISRAIESVLDRWTLADLAREEREEAERRQHTPTYII